jgi:hypothetical protein
MKSKEHSVDNSPSLVTKIIYQANLLILSFGKLLIIFNIGKISSNSVFPKSVDM